MNARTRHVAAGLILIALASCKSGSKDADQPAPAQPAQPAHGGDAVVDRKPAPKPVARASVGEAAPDFTLTDIAGKTHSLSSYRGKTVVLEWFSPACPYCVYAYSDGPLAEQPERLMKDGVVWLSVNSQNPKHPGAKLEKNKAFVEQYRMEAPLLLDPDGVVGRSYGAKTTPHCFVIDAKGVLVYAGGLDNAPNGEVEGDGPATNYVDAAIADLKAGRPVATKSTPAYG